MVISNGKQSQYTGAAELRTYLHIYTSRLTIINDEIKKICFNDFTYKSIVVVVVVVVV